MDNAASRLSVAEIAKQLEAWEAVKLKRLKEGGRPLEIVDYITSLDPSGTIPTNFVDLDRIMAGAVKLSELAVIGRPLPFYKSALYDHCRLKVILESTGDKQFEYNVLNQTFDQVAPELDP